MIALENLSASPRKRGEAQSFASRTVRRLAPCHLDEEIDRYDGLTRPRASLDNQDVLLARCGLRGEPESRLINELLVIDEGELFVALEHGDELIGEAFRRSDLTVFDTVEDLVTIAVPNVPSEEVLQLYAHRSSETLEPSVGILHRRDG